MSDEVFMQVIGWIVAVFCLGIAFVKFQLDKGLDTNYDHNYAQPYIMLRPTIEQEVGQMIIKSLRNEPYLWILDRFTIHKDGVHIWISGGVDDISLYDSKKQFPEKFDNVFTEYHKEGIYEEYKRIKYSRMMGTADLRYIITEKI